MTFSANIQKIIPGIGLLVVGVFLGWLFFAGGGGESSAADAGDHAHEAGEATVWTCSMHPQIRQEEPGLCPICAMDLIPLEGDGAASAPDKIQMTDEAVAAANVRTVTVKRGLPFREIRLPGRVDADEARLADITARVGGRIEKLHVNITGQRVVKGAKLATLYSPDLVAAQKELLEAARMKDTHPEYYRAAQSKLRFWDLTDAQIDAIVETGEVRRTFDVLAPQGGTVLMRHVAEGEYVREGQSMFAIADLGRVWVMFDAYESDLAWLRNGMTVDFTVAGQPGRTYSGRIDFIDPVIDPGSRVAHVRVEMPNPGGTLKPEMFATGVVKSTLPGRNEEIVIPRTAVLWTGKRSVVWVKDRESDIPIFEYREVRLGTDAGDSYVVLDGLVVGEEIVAHGVFTIDAAAQLQGKTSMMNAVQEHELDEGINAGSGRPEPTARPGETPPSASGNPAPAAFRSQLMNVFDRYNTITNALVASDPAAVIPAARATEKALDAVTASSLGGVMRTHWAEMLQGMRTSLEAMRATRDLEQQRGYYSGLSNTLHQALKHFGVSKKTVYWQYCPMAFNDRGAYWLSAVKEIRNPYFGDEMLKCGVVKEIMENQ